MNLYILLKALHSVSQNVTEIKISKQLVFLKNKKVYIIRLYKSLLTVEVQFSIKYENMKFSEFKNIEILLESSSRKEIISTIFQDTDEIII